MEICWAFEGTTSVREDSGQSRFSFTIQGISIYWIIFKKRRSSDMNGGLVCIVAVMMVQISALKMYSVYQGRGASEWRVSRSLPFGCYPDDFLLSPGKVWSLYSDKNVRKYVGNPIAELTSYNIKIWCVYWSPWNFIHTNQGSASCKSIETPNFWGVLDICAALEKTKTKDRIPTVNFYGNLNPHDKDKQGDSIPSFRIVDEQNDAQVGPFTPTSLTEIADTARATITVTPNPPSPMAYYRLQTKTIEVSNVSLEATERDIKEFFSFSGDIEYVEMQRSNEGSQVAYITFKDLQGAETALLLSGAIIVGLSVSISLAPDYKLPPAAFVPPPVAQNKTPGAGDSAIRKAEDVVTGMLAKGFILGKDAVKKDEKHQLTSKASAKVASFDKKIGFADKIQVGTTIVGDKVREVDQKFQVSKKTKSAFATAQQKVSSVGSAIMKNRYVCTGASWVTGAFSKVAKAAGDVGQKTKEKVGAAEEKRKRNVVDDFAQIHLSESPIEQQPSKPAAAQGLIL
ncbi:hypothetical protein V6N11_035205 [Hibiscus sabdariffa]|uniref:RRM domain-containing protein n=1 Tax=Hibiscus sabdariffa TaxID=183260 RepID=A0ABR2QZN9_9ROSI